MIPMVHPGHSLEVLSQSGSMSSTEVNYVNLFADMAKSGISTAMTDPSTSGFSQNPHAAYFAACITRTALEKGYEMLHAQTERYCRRREDLLNEAGLIDVSGLAMARGGVRDEEPRASTPTTRSPSQPPTLTAASSREAAPSLSVVYRQCCEALGVALQRSVLEALRVVEQALNHNKHHEATASLDVSNVVLGAKGFVPILDTLEQCSHSLAPCLGSITLAGCGLSDRCVECLSLLLLRQDYHRYLSRIDVSDNPKIGIIGGTALREYVAASLGGARAEPSIHVVRPLRHVCVAGTSIRSSTARSIHQLLITGRESNDVRGESECSRCNV